ncbi:MAG: hypothetical protein NPIRA04_13430 [Nitrospirales bacterium]|nr:MAG: hypothetical protein NPIRA04_13430 [Nitrospirales bacterium]
MKQLQAQAIKRKDLRGLAERPLLLTVMVQLHTFQGKLPDDRTELYNDAVDLLMERWQQRLGQETGLVQHLDIPHLKMTDLRDGLCDVAFQAHQLTSSEETPDIRESDLRQCLQTYLGGSWDKAGQFVQYIRERSGLLIPHKTDAYRFPHRTFQEFLAACYLLRTDHDPGRPASLVQQDFDRWREVFVLACGFAARKYSINKALAFINHLCPEGVSDIASPQPQHWRFAQLAADALLEVGLLGVKREKAGQVLLERVQEWIEGAMRHDEVIVKDRVQADRTLGLLGDRRKDVLDPLQTEFIKVADGPFKMGEKSETIMMTVPYIYYISKFPVTQSQFRAFVDDNGYRHEAYWPEAKAAGVWKAGMVQGRYDDQPRGKPEDFDEPFSLPNHPVVGVTWYEALAYCRWLTERLQAWEGTPEPVRILLRTGGKTGKPWSITLPNEPEWEKAARGVEDDRVYPWGNHAEPNFANYGETQVNATSAVGCFPKGASPFKLEEMSGNVWEWTRSLYEEDSYPAKPNEWTRRENLMADQAKDRVLRGGSWFDSDYDVRCASRSRLGPVYWDLFIGFRVVASPFSEP